MNISLPKETYPLEKRTVVLPNLVNLLVSAGHIVSVEQNLGSEIHISDDEYRSAGAKIIVNPIELYKNADMIVKLKSPSPEEFSLMQDSLLICMFHSEQNPDHLFYAKKNNLSVIELESIKTDSNERLINQTDLTGLQGVYYALRHFDKTPEDMNALILGYGNVSSGAFTACTRLGMNTKILRKSEYKFVSDYLKNTDLLVNGITWPESARKKKEYIVSREDIINSNKSLVILDLSVDFPNPIETIKPTSYSHPFYLEEDRVHISIYGYPGLVPISSSKKYSSQLEDILLLIANNDGIRGIQNRSDLGKYIKRGYIDPTKIDLGDYIPQGFIGSNIE